MEYSIGEYLRDLFSLQESIKKEDAKEFQSNFRKIVNYPLDHIEYLYSGSSSYICFPKKKVSSTKKSILLVVHELSRTGAPIVALDAAKLLVKNGYFVTVISLYNGPLLDDFLKDGIPVVISRELTYLHYKVEGVEVFKDKLDLDIFVASFDSIIMVTATLYNFIRRYMHFKKKIIWWIHEGSTSYDILGNKMPKYLSSNIKVYCGGKYAVKQLEKYGFQYFPKVLNYGVDDLCNMVEIDNKKMDRILFMIVGTLSIRKGQLLLLEAIKRLPLEVLRKAEFIFIGDAIVDDPVSFDIKDQIQSYAKVVKNVHYYTSVSREKLFEFYRCMDVLVVSSLDDPMPVVATESFMFHKICLCSAGAGTSCYIRDGKNGFVFENGNVVQLAEKIVYIVNHKNELDSIKEAGRKIYDNYFDMRIFEKNLLEVVSGGSRE